MDVTELRKRYAEHGQEHVFEGMEELAPAAREEWGGRRLPPVCTEPLTELVELVRKRWVEYGL